MAHVDGSSRNIAADGDLSAYLAETGWYASEQKQSQDKRGRSFAADGIEYNSLPTDYCKGTDHTTRCCSFPTRPHAYSVDIDRRGRRIPVSLWP